ncbi:MAG: DUF6036 family nucleotidyltransferase [Acidobacteriota bacterium]
MKKELLLSLIQQVRDLTGIEAPIIVGSQSLFAFTDNVPAMVKDSIECDFMLGAESIEAMIAVNKSLGVTSQFARINGYYADGLGLATVVLAPGWQDRLHPLSDEQGRVVARCLEMHDAAVSKLMAGRDKDWPFIKALLDGGLISLPTLAERAAMIRDTVHKDALLPRLNKLIEHLRRQFRAEELRPLTDLAHQLS